eukprot:TRINITY_DN1071_c1_g1_i1.p1 TRINITY_DN1071_c1_g1~~TRINITY_DN1071_c1_g1_i1.p1  ORF type:complete len:336 (+),score=129.94 TRINITY_DN1071_c1_g1_i1:49-1056(+)
MNVKNVDNESDNNQIPTFELFCQVHIGQFLQIGLPETLYKPLYEKLYPVEVFDAGESLQLIAIESEDDEVLEFNLKVKEEKGELKKHEDVFLIDHCWTWDTIENAKKILEQNHLIVGRLVNIMCIKEGIDTEEDLDEAKNISIIMQQCDINYDVAKECYLEAGGELINSILIAEEKKNDSNQFGQFEQAILNSLINKDDDSNNNNNNNNNDDDDKNENQNNKEEEENDNKIEINKIIEKMKEGFAQSYVFAVPLPDNQYQYQRAWYILDEIGSSIEFTENKEEENCSCKVFVDSFRGITYSILFPTKDISSDDTFISTRNSETYNELIKREKQKK